MMMLRFVVLLPCGLCLAAAAAAQQQPAVWSPPAMLKGPCPDTLASKTAWFEPGLYPLLGNGVKAGRAVYHQDPGYSESARQAKIQGTVLLAVAITAEGVVDAVKVVCSLEPCLDRNAADAVKKWESTPATKEGKPVPVQIEVAVGFSLY